MIILMKPSRNIKINEPNRARYSRLDAEKKSVDESEPRNRRETHQNNLPMNGTLAITPAARYGTDWEKMKEFRDSNWESFASSNLEGESGDNLDERT